MYPLPPSVFYRTVSGRTRRSVSLYRAVLVLFLIGLASGCQRHAVQAPPAEPPAVPVSHPVEREVTDYVDYTGRTDAVQSVSVRARVTGYLTKMPFREGAVVKKDDLLFEIDPRPYQAQLDQAQGQLAVYEAQLALAEATLKRAQGAKTAFSPLEIDTDKAAVEQAAAQVKAAKASLEVYKLNLDFTQVKSPIDGVVSRYYYTLGNLVTQDQTLLTTIVSMNPMYSYFDIEEKTFQRLVKGNSGAGKSPKGKSGGPPDGKAGPTAAAPSAPELAPAPQAGALTAPPPPGALTPAPPAGTPPRKAPPSSLSTGPVGLPDSPVLMGLEGEAGFPHRGKLDFLNNQVNPSTGTVAARALFDNPRKEGEAWSLIPGMFARIRLPLGVPHRAMLVIDRAIGSDQGLKFVYVIDAENKVQYRRVTVGPLQEDGLRVIEDGIKSDDWVVVGALQQLRPRTEVRPEQIAMPTLAGEGDVPPRRKGGDGDGGKGGKGGGNPGNGKR